MPSPPPVPPPHAVPPASAAPAPRRRPRWPWFLLLGLVLLCGLGVWAAQKVSQTVTSGMETTSGDGEAAGQGKTQDACFDLAHARYDDASPMQAPAAMGFVMGCLKTATPSPKMCEGVPTDADDRAATQAWVTERCGTKMGCIAIESARAGACGAAADIAADSAGA